MTGSAALTWLNDLMQWLGRWVPRLVLVQPTHRGVLFGPKGGAREVGPGLVFYWPITHALVEIPVTTVSIQLSGQVLQLLEGSTGIVPHVAVCAAAVQFRVVDAVAAATRCLHLHALVDNRANAAIARHWSGDLAAPPDLWIANARKALAVDLEGFGVELEHLDITQLGRGVALKNIQDWSYADSANGKRPEGAHA